MKIILLFLFTLISNNCLSQHYIEKVDEFTGNTIIECSTHKQDAAIISSIGKEQNVYIKLYAVINKNGKKNIFLDFEIITLRLLCFSKKEGKMIILLTDGTKITLNQYSDLKCDTHNIIRYYINDVDITNIINNNIENIRVLSTEGYFDITIKEKKKQLIKDTFIKFNMNIQ